MIYNTYGEYVYSVTEIAVQIARYDQIIAALQMSLIDGMANAGLSEYQLDDGQTKIRAAYRGPDQVAAAVMGMERLKFALINRLAGRKTRLVDFKNFRY